MAAPTTTLIVRPKLSLLANAFAGVILGTAPIFAVAYWFTASRGLVPLVAAANITVVTGALLLVWRQLRVFCAVTDTELIGNGIFTPLVRVRLGDIREVTLVPTYLGAAPDPVLQLLVTDIHGERVFRMRGNYWHERDLVALANALPVRPERVREPMTIHDFFRLYPGSAFWFERSRAAKAVLITLAVVLGSAFVAAVMLMLGLPVRFL